MYATVDRVNEMIALGRHLIVAGDEPLLRALPKGNWIGGTIPYFMTPDGGQMSRSSLYVTETPALAKDVRIAVYDEESLSQVGIDSPSTGYSILIIPAFANVHQQFAIKAPRYDQLFFKSVAGWIAGSHLDDLGKVAPKVCDGRTGTMFDSRAVALHVELPSGWHARVGIVNIFEQGDGEDIIFPASGFEASECVIAGKRQRISESLGHMISDTRWPLVANYCGTRCNVGIRELDLANDRIRFFAPVFEGVTYRQARSVGNYPERFLSAIPKDIKNIAFSCNCVHNYSYGQLQGQRTGDLEGPMTFGEIAYQLLNQTLVYIAIEKNGR
jgi:hypothetical protein